MMSIWLSAKELAELKVSCLPKTKRGINMMANGQNWHYRRRLGYGGGFEYEVDSLPSTIRTAVMLAARARTEKAQSAEIHRARIADYIAARRSEALAERDLARLPWLDAKVKERMEARERLLELRDEFARRSGMSITRGSELFCEAYNARRLDLPAEVYGTVGSVTPRTLHNWAAAVKTDGCTALGGRYGNRKDKTLIDRDPDLANFIVGMLHDHPHASDALVMKGLRARFDGRRLPSYRSVQRWVKAWKKNNKQLFCAIKNPDQWRNKYLAADGSASERADAPNRLWEFDGTPADILLADGSRHAIIGVIDVATRRLKLHVSRSNSAAAVAALIRKAIMDWGVPEVAKTDNGSDYVSQHIKRVFNQLDVYQDLCPPFSPERKPHIERAFRTFSHDLLELMAGYIGHNVAERKDIEARRSFADRLMKRGESVEIRITAEELQQFCDDWCANVYMHTPHKGLNGKTPFEAMAAWRGTVKKIADERALDVLLAAAPGGDGLRTVTKKGISVDNALYSAAGLAGYEGRQVKVRYDEADIGTIYVFDAETGEFVCKAICPEIAGVSRAEIGAHRRQAQKRLIAEGKKAVREIAKAAKTSDVVREIMTQKAVAAGKVTMFPGAQEAHRTAALEEALQAIRAGEVKETPVSDKVAAMQAEIEKEYMTGGAPVIRLDTPATRFRRALDIESRRDKELSISDEEKFWYDGYIRGPEYTNRKSFAEDFGLEAALDLD